LDAPQEERREEETVDVELDEGHTGERGEPVAGGPTDKTERRSASALLIGVIDGITQLVRHEVELARIEATEAIAVKGKGAGLLAGAAVLALYAIGFLAAAGAVGLAIVLPLWAALLIVGGVFIVFGVVLFALGRRDLRAPTTVRRTQETVKEDVRWAKQQIGR
jgi:Putative Actinobacterial Holin-X, holin superfamily III